MSFEFNQEHSNIAKLISSENPVLSQDIVPHVYIYWYGHRKNGDYGKILDTKTGIITEYEDEITPGRYGYKNHTFIPRNILNVSNRWNSPDYGSCAITTPGTTMDTYYARYIENYDCLEFGHARMSLDRQPEKHYWTNDNWLLDRMFLFHDDPIIYNRHGGRAFSEKFDGKFYNTEAARHIAHMASYVTSNKYFNIEVQKFTKDICTKKWSNGNFYPWTFAEWYKTFLPRPTSKHATDIESLELSELNWNILGPKYPPHEICIRDGNNRYRTSYNVTFSTVVIFEKINDNMSVFRICEGSTNEYPYERTERMRMYIDSKGKITITEIVDRQWRITSRSGAKFSDKIIPVNFEQMYEVKNLKYIKVILDNEIHNFESLGQTDKHFNKSLTLIAMIMRHPILEKIYKAGYKNLFRYLISNGEVAASIEDLFGVKESKKPLFEALNTNKYILNWLEKTNDFGHTKHSMLIWAEEVAGCDIRKLTQESIETILDSLLVFKKKGYDYKKFLQHNDANTNFGYWGWRQYTNTEGVRQLTDEERNKAMRLFRLNKKHPEFLTMLSDVRSMYSQLNHDVRPNIDLFEIEDMYACQHIHETLQDILTQQRLEARAKYDEEAKKRLEKEKESADKLYPKRVEKYEYTDGEFSIVVPKSPADLVTEGTALSHCIASYGSRFSNGATDILFMRKNNALNRPYCSIEVHDGHVVQAHKAHNAWPLSGSDGLGCARFLYKYFTLKKLSYDKNILLSKSDHYGQGQDFGNWEDITKDNPIK